MPTERSNTYPNYETPQHTPQKCGIATVPNVTETPREARPLAAAEAKTTLIRYEVGLAMNREIFVCEVDIFMDHYLPEVKDETHALVLEGLQKRKVLVPRQTTGSSATTPVETTSGATPPSPPPEPYSHVFKSFKPPCTMETTGDNDRALENKTFKPLTAIGAAICNILKREAGIKPNGYVIRMCGDNPLRSRINGGNHKIDACMTKNKKWQLRITDVAVAFEFKAKRAKVKENRLQIVSHFNHAMNDDARRTFILGITIEDDRVSLWYCSRSHSVKARSFSMVEHADLYVKIMISLFCATDEQLGFDPLVQLTNDYNFIYTFPASDDCPEAKHYRTKHSIFESRSLGLAGRSTRIWQVELVDPKNDYLQVAGVEDMILKDVSLDADTPTETDIQERIFSDIEKLKEDTENPWREHPMVKGFADEHKAFLEDLFEGGGERWKDLFSRIIATAIRPPGHSVAPQVWADDTIFPVSELDTLSVNPFQTIRPTPGIQKSCDETKHAEKRTLGEIVPKKRCLYIFERVYTPLSNISTLGEAVDVLKQCLDVLRLIFCAGWVHRDISAGNILAWWDGSKKKWQVKLSDLKYAKKFPGKKGRMSSGIPKTGTPFFMAVEIQDGALLLPQDFIDEVISDEEDLDSLSQLGKFVMHTFQHDLEPFWWLFLWLSTARVNRTLPQLFADAIFQAGYLGKKEAEAHLKSRKLALTTSLLTDKNFRPSLPEEMKPDFTFALDRLRKDLVSEYRKRNVEGKQDDLGTYSYIMSTAFQKFFQKIEGSREKWNAIELLAEQDVTRKGGEDGHGLTEREPDSGLLQKRKATDELEAEDTSVIGVKKVTFALDVEKDYEEGTATSTLSRGSVKKVTFTLVPEQEEASDGPEEPQKGVEEGKRASARIQRENGPTTRSMTQAGGAGKARSAAKPQEKSKKVDHGGPKPSKRARR
ncbi:other/FunK1 protein kinase [Coprinopsis cinerea okayama7|uniref:Other/FunK1 protein kinase n=1 Tax=Coprinopsis cinerea (strain Okayama-7 / 130 / ATCC MYA-4618 / FGSC 9003) TaxID=240176 RepID=A8NAV8_COPC7|nr:other/FunK1 protein kinase [Coprinopsis cinerea okayama7\|eukprot:XP_001831960.1 other/FunK1 protein kinase [Coprinopsis cinerea okayama7\